MLGCELAHGGQSFCFNDCQALVQIIPSVCIKSASIHEWIHGLPSQPVWDAAHGGVDPLRANELSDFQGLLVLRPDLYKLSLVVFKLKAF